MYTYTYEVRESYDVDEPIVFLWSSSQFLDIDPLEKGKNKRLYFAVVPKRKTKFNVEVRADF